MKTKKAIKRLFSRMEDFADALEVQQFAARNTLSCLDSTDEDVADLEQRVRRLENPNNSCDTPTKVEDAIAYVVDDHRILHNDPTYWQCTCGKMFDSLAGEYRRYGEHISDMLIRELKLEREFSIGDDDGGRVLWLDGEEPVTPKQGEVVEVRWISPWVRSDG